MAHSRPTIERRQLGAELRRLRDAAGKSQKEAAELIECDTSLISRTECGQRSLKALELTALLDYYEAPPGKRKEILEIGRVARQRQSRRMYSDAFPGAFRRVSDHEQEATEIYYSEGELIPGLLQTEDYIRALMQIAWSAFSDAAPRDIEAHVEFRLERQQILEREDPPLLWFVIGEAALRRPVGRRDVMRDQLKHLLEVDERHRHAVIQVVPLSIVDHPLPGCAIAIFRFGGAAPDIAHQSTFVGGGVYMDDEGDVARCSYAFDRLRAAALGPQDSRDFVIKCMEE